MKPVEFIQDIAPAAVESMKLTGIPASAVIAQGALESSWGASKLATEGFNLFGVKADAAWSGATLTLQTREFLRGQWAMLPAKWRKYGSWVECLNDHAKFFQVNKRYAAALKCREGELFSRLIAAAGYATDPNYADKLVTIIQIHKLAKFDKEPT